MRSSDVLLYTDDHALLEFCDLFCNPILHPGLGVTNPYGRRMYMLKITFLTMVPIVALIGVNISSLVGNITQTLHAINLKQEIEFSLDVAKVRQRRRRQFCIFMYIMSYYILV